MSIQTFLGFDYGWRRLGIAVGNDLTGSARPLTTLSCHQGQPNWETLARLIAQWKPSALVVGIPCHADGTASKTTAHALTFAHRLEQRYGLPIHRMDERLSSHEARSRLCSAGQQLQNRDSKAAIDRIAAQIILETWFSEQG